ncbi:dioxygenase family protein [Sphingobium sp. EP60837]|uniref:dioxygenase family protein n=1 Tax=Sphingobium sp. EP60837 TaxID=1855519 RepID=UPI0007DD4CAB|nr:dioxygenase [Sphingobium sp. EP60837]ANI80212.1 Catechol 1,2-dioxygenase [Sphingobium sp. EP60837]
MTTDEEALTADVLEAMSHSGEPRLQEVMTSLVSHLHAFVREIRPSVEEWRVGIDFVTALGHLTTAHHNEVILASDTWGVSTLVDMINRPGDGATESALLGPFWKAEAPFLPLGESIAHAGTAGTSVVVSGRVRDRSGAAIAGAVIDVWQTDDSGYYENQYPEGSGNLRGRFKTDENGEYNFRTIKPVSYPIPTHGPVGALTLRQKRSIFRPAHLHAMISAPGYRTLVTQIFSPGDPYLERDVTFSVVQGLIGLYETAPANADYDEIIQFDFILAEGTSVLPEAPIGGGKLENDCQEN